MESWQRLDGADSDTATRLLRTCCGSRAWVERMLRRRPFGSREAMLSAARDEWLALSESDWREAFAQHPEIGDREALRRRFADTSHLSGREQAGVESASEDVLTALAELNRRYRQRFGHIFIVCATGLTANEMLDRLRTRIHNDAAAEMRIAVEEQARITELRLLGL